MDTGNGIDSTPEGSAAPVHKGVEFFWSGKFDEVVEFYSKAGIDKPWAKFYSGAALLEKAEMFD